MAATLSGFAMTPSYNNQCGEPDYDSIFDFSQVPSPTPRMHSSPASNTASPTNTIVALDQSEDLQTPAKPSHEYERFKQQTGLPSNSVPGLAQQFSPSYAFSNSGTGLDEMSLMGSSSNSMLDAGWNSGLGMGSDVNMELDLSINTTGLPPSFLYGGESSHSGYIDPSAIATQEESVRYYPGMHQKQAAMAKAHAQAQQQRQQQIAQQQLQQKQQQQHMLQPARRNGSQQSSDPHTEEVIGRIMGKIRHESTLSSQDGMSPSGSFPHVHRSKKDEEDMDEDERLLASEEGKKLSSKERRQLRNKVSARAFRSRRKEYIVQLEEQLANKQKETDELRFQNRNLQEENAGLRDLTQSLLRHKAFVPYIDSISRDQSVMNNIKPDPSPSHAPTPEPSRKDLNPYSSHSQQFQDMSQNDHPQIGMALVPETPLDMSMLNLGNNWMMPNQGFNYQQIQTFAVTELPEGPAAPIDIDILSGKGGESFMPTTSPVDDAKAEYPVIERPIEREEVTEVTEVEEEEEDDDEFDLYRSSPARKSNAVVTPIEDCELIFGDADTEKVFAHFELFISDDAASEKLMERFEKISCRHVPRSKASDAPTLNVNTLKDLLTSHSPRKTTARPSSHRREPRIFKVDRGLPSGTAPAVSFVQPSNSPVQLPREFGGRQRSRPRPSIPPTPSNIVLEPFPGDGDNIELKSFKGGHKHPMKSSIQFLTVPTADTPGTALYLFFDNQRYLIGNMAEGTQRAATQTGTKLMKINDILITGRTEWSNIGGLVGMILTLADSNASSVEGNRARYEKMVATGKLDKMPDLPVLNLYGAPNLNHMLGTCRRFVFRKGMPLRAVEFKDDTVKRDSEGNVEPTWSDEYISVWALPLKPAETSDSEAFAKQELRNQTFDQLNSKNKEYVAPEGELPEDRELRYDRMRRSIVRHMFDSDWRFDALVEKHISEVQMPAAIFVRDPETHKIEKYTGPMPGSEAPLPDIKVMVRTPWPAALLELLPPTEPSPVAISYIFRPHAQRGKFDPKKALTLNIGDKKKWSILANGENVLNDAGETITPDMVLGPPRTSGGVAIIDLPSIGYVDSLVAREEWRSEKVKSGIMGFVWTLGPGVAASPRLRQFMKEMDHCKHIVSSVDTCPNTLTMVDAAASTLRLAQVDNERYRVPHHDNVSLPQDIYNRSSTFSPELPPNTIAAKVGMAFAIEPQFQLDNTLVKYPLNTQGVLDDTEASVFEFAKSAREEIQASRGTLDAWKQKMPRPDTEIITLGTGSAQPSKYRNVSATLVRVPGVGSYLLDCGENTLGQLRRVFKPAELKEVLRDLRMIWISHLHADHHLGTASLIKAWYSVVHDSTPTTESPNLKPAPGSPPQRRLAVVSHMGMASWLHEYAAVEDFGFSRLLPLCISGNDRFRLTAASKASELTLYAAPGGQWTPTKVPPSSYEALLGVADIQAVFVNHCHGAMAVCLTFPPDASAAPDTPPLKVSYSGDCRPSGRFASIGQGTSVLVHEATFDDELAADAVAKKHSTTSEALRVAGWMGARGVVLTHFSQRYQKIPVLREVEDEEEEDEEEGDALGREDGEESGGEEGMVDAPEVERGRSPSPRLRGSAGREQVIRVKGDMKVAIAFDYMRVRIGDIAVMERFNPALARLLAYAGAEEESTKKEEVVVQRGGKKKEKKGGQDMESPKRKARRFN
ncbi:uncharacterized protein BDZ99DRAFT_493642 [Mytilinidion resinicola]|uniref:ribonuclease Z n=1 Tax=Mytilinidion resinicola TaxID=574789 RepID=A0A6A6Z492_9PEZI|nr:uncharacterized protein BDZ99DRAFT_493642 [Mytilinidion resinicola]KAF2815638.1 hypothetical protein BDZ99DRAFT_493642 [Mytilinidion resinicola]